MGVQRRHDGGFPVREIAIALILSLFAWVPVSASETPVPALVGLPVVDALQHLRRAGLRVVYSSELVGADAAVIEEPSTRDPVAAARQILWPHGLELAEGPGGLLVVVERSVHDAPVLPGTLAGVIRSTSGRPLGGAVVRILPGQLSIAAGDDGVFGPVTLRPGVYSLEVASDAYASGSRTNIRVIENRTTSVSVALEPLPVALEEIVVTSHPRTEAEGWLARSSEIGPEGLPVFGSDLIQAVALRSGAAASDRGSGLNVRGGEPGEMLVRLDGLELFEFQHLGALATGFSSIDSAVLHSAKVLTGNFSVEYGDRMSGVIDLSTKLPERKMFELAVGTVNARGTAGGISRRKQAQWLVSARRWYPDLLVNLTDPHGEPWSPNYYDLLARVRKTLAGGELTASLLHANDNLEVAPAAGVEALETSTNSHHLWGTMQLLPRPWLLTQTILSGGNLRRSRDGRFETGDIAHAVIDQRGYRVWTLKQDIAFSDGGSGRIKLGFGGSRSRARYDYSFRRQPAPETVPVPLRELALDPVGNEYHAYVDYRLKPHEKVTLETGLRWDRQTYLPDAANRFSPRLGLSWSLAPRTTLTAAWGHYHQSQDLHRLQVEDGERNFQPTQRATRLALGLEKRFGSAWRLGLHGYRNEISDPIVRYENVLDPFGFFPEAESDRIRLAPEKGLAKGVEVTLEGRPGAGAQVVDWLLVGRGGRPN